MATQLVHNGIVVAPRPERHGLVLAVRGERVALDPYQEEMALAWARKIGTPYVDDPVFASNYLLDFSAALAIEPPLTLAEVDFGPALAVVEAEREAKARLSAEERRQAAAERKAQREALKEQFGYALVNGERVALGNYMTEPSGIFMGRGKHPLRGRWKQGAEQHDVTLNLSPDAPRPAGNWGEITWQPESLWVARWEDKLTGKLKYIWLHDTAPIKQRREAAKFDKALLLGEHLAEVRAHIQRDLGSADAKVRMVATACHLIDTLCLRVGDEKDPDEADTVGATTLRPEHVTLHDDGTGEFRFLGKDSVLWHKKVELSPLARDNLAYLIDHARPSASSKQGRDLPQLFPDISSRDVNNYLSGLLPGLSAKVFRTHHATHAVIQTLDASDVSKQDPEYRKRETAVLANLEAAVLCNHTKQAPANWSDRRARMQERREKAEARVEQTRVQLAEFRDKQAALRAESREQVAAAGDKQRTRVRERYRKRLQSAQRQVDAARGRLERARLALGKVESQNRLAARGRAWNLGTSLKSYIDPRVYYRWGRSVDYDVLARFYPQALQHRFVWVAEADEEE